MTIKDEILNSIEFNENEIENFDTIFEIQEIDLTTYEKRNPNFFNEFEIKTKLVFCYNKEMPSKDFNILSYNKNNILDTIHIQKVINVLELMDNQKLEIVSDLLLNVIKKETMEKIVLKLELRDKNKIKEIQYYKQKV